MKRCDQVRPFPSLPEEEEEEEESPGAAVGRARGADKREPPSESRGLCRRVWTHFKSEE